MSDTHRAIGEHHSCGVPIIISGLRLTCATRRGRETRAYEFYSDLLIIEQVRALKDDTKGTLSDLLAAEDRVSIVVSMQA